MNRAGELLHQIAAQVATAHQLHVAACQRVGVEAVLLNELGGHPQYAVGADVGLLAKNADALAKRFKC